jgi:hypothetical protein
VATKGQIRAQLNQPQIDAQHGPSPQITASIHAISIFTKYSMNDCYANGSQKITGEILQLLIQLPCFKLVMETQKPRSVLFC